MKLLDGRTSVPTEAKVFLNERRSSKYLKGDIDTLSLYWEVGDQGNSVQNVYRFYGNGAVNLFTFLKEENNYDKFFDPAYNGYRGYYYESSGCLMVDYFGPISDSYETGRITERFEIRGDTLKVFRGELKYFDTYIRRPMPKNIMNFKATW